MLKLILGIVLATLLVAVVGSILRLLLHIVHFSKRTLRYGFVVTVAVATGFVVAFALHDATWAQAFAKDDLRAGIVGLVAALAMIWMMREYLRTGREALAGDQSAPLPVPLPMPSVSAPLVLTYKRPGAGRFLFTRSAPTVEMRLVATTAYLSRLSANEAARLDDCLGHLTQFIAEHSSTTDMTFLTLHGRITKWLDFAEDEFERTGPDTPGRIVRHLAWSLEGLALQCEQCVAGDRQVRQEDLERVLGHIARPMV